MNEPATTRRWPLAAAVLGGFTVVGLISSSLTWSTWQAEHLGVGFGLAVLLTLPYWLFWAAVTPVIVALGRRAPIGTTRWPRALLVHVTACALIVLAHTSFYMWLNLRYFPFPSTETVPGFGGMIASYLRSRWSFEVIMYWAILGAALAAGYAREAQRRQVRASALEAQLAQSQLQALRMQLHPHFLFNTLQAISVLVDENPRAARQMLTQLGDLLRTVLDGDERQEVPLAEELTFLRRYLAIEQVRFPDRLAVTFAVDDAARDVLVPAFLLQPLVENAIRYAIAPSAAPGRIAVEARLAGRELQLAVRDSGPGFPDPVTDGVGLATTRARLAKLYGDAHRLTLGRGPDGGAEAAIVLPARREDATDG